MVGRPVCQPSWQISTIWSEFKDTFYLTYEEGLQWLGLHYLHWRRFRLDQEIHGPIGWGSKFILPQNTFCVPIPCIIFVVFFRLLFIINDYNHIANCYGIINLYIGGLTNVF